MVEVWFSLFVDVEEELSKGKETTAQLKRLGAKLNNRFERLAKAIEYLEKNDWVWETNFKYVVLIKNISERQARKELKKSGMNMGLVRFNIPL